MGGQRGGRMYNGGGNGLVCLQSITVYIEILSTDYFMLSFFFLNGAIFCLF